MKSMTTTLWPLLPSDTCNEEPGTGGDKRCSECDGIGKQKELSQFIPCVDYHKGLQYNTGESLHSFSAYMFLERKIHGPSLRSLTSILRCLQECYLPFREADQAVKSREGERSIWHLTTSHRTYTKKINK